MDMVTGIWDAAAVAIITDGAEAAVITMDGHAADTADGISCDIEAALDNGGCFSCSHCARLKRSDRNLINLKNNAFYPEPDTAQNA